MKGSNNDSLWNEEGTSLKITIVPPIWSAWWFRGGLLLLLVGIALGGYWLRVRNMEARSLRLEREVQQRTAELSQANKLLAREIAERIRAEEALARKAADDAVVAERGRLARDLHDAVTQTLFSASLIAEALPALWESDPKEGRELLSELRMLSRGAMAEMRTLLLELRPASLAQADLGDLLRQLADAFVGRTGTTIIVHSEVRITLYRIAQEALNNIVKHAKASHVELSLNRATAPPDVDRKTPHRVELRVSDDGRGFDPTTVQPGHHGLSIIRERASAIGADLTVDSQPDQGTEIVVMWEERQ
jgi:signal transduction histidine kinase